MKKFLPTAGCMVGGGLMGFSAGRMDTLVGVISFVAGALLLTYSTSVILKEVKNTGEETEHERNDKA